MRGVSEASAIAQTERPATVRTLVTDLHELGVTHGNLIIVHSSLSRLGWVVGGAQAIVEALFEAVGPTGTIVMPSQSSAISDPVDWTNPPVPPEWIETIRNEMPVYDPASSPTRGMGAVVDCFLHHPATLRSAHPTVSFAANGPAATEITRNHQLSPGLGAGSPLDRLYDLDAKVVLLGVDHANTTSLHLAEHRATWPGKVLTSVGVPLVVDGQRRWVTYDDLELDEGDFVDIGAAFAATGPERSSTIGVGRGRACSMRAIVDFAVEWMSTHRS